MTVKSSKSLQKQYKNVYIPFKVVCLNMYLLYLASNTSLVERLSELMFPLYYLFTQGEVVLGGIGSL